MTKSFVLIAALAFPAGAYAQATTASATATANADALGTWDATFNTQNGAIPAQLKLRKDGSKIVGTIASQQGEAPIEAQVKDKTLVVWFTFQNQNGPVPIEMNGTIDGDKIKGTFSASGQTAGDWLATRAKDSTSATKADTPATTTSTSSTTAASLSGDWNVSVELPNMTANPGLTLKQDGEKLTGDYISAQYGKFPVTGTVKGSDVVFSFNMSIEGSAMTVTYTGAVEKDGTLKGAVNYGDMMSGTFVASRKK